MSEEISPLHLDCIIFQQMLLEGEIEKATLFSENLLSRSRSAEERDHLIEARIRMDRALIGAIGEDEVGTELRWCVDRLNAIESGSPLHGLALLNLANWHSSVGELMMALVVHSDINRLSGHPDDIRGLSRLEAGRLMVAMGDLDPAMRHLWTARGCFADLGMEAEHLVASLEWLNLALEECDETAPRMSSRLENSAPRSGGGNTWIPSNPDDIREVAEYLYPILSQDLSGEERNDIGLILDAGEAIGESKWQDSLISRIDEFHDARLLEVLQS